MVCGDGVPEGHISPVEEQAAEHAVVIDPAAGFVKRILVSD